MDRVLRIPEGGERRFVAPRFEDQDPDRDALVKAALDLRLGTRLRVPLVAAHPRAEDPGRRHARSSGLGKERGEDDRRGALVDGDLDPRRRLARIELDLDPDAIRVGGADVVPGASGRADMEAPAVRRGIGRDDDREWHRQVRSIALVLVLLEDGRIEPSATLVECVEALAEADDVGAVLEAQGQANPPWAVLGTKPGNGTGHQPRTVAGEARALRIRCPGTGHVLEPSRACAATDEAVGHATPCGRGVELDAPPAPWPLPWPGRFRGWAAGRRHDLPDAVDLDLGVEGRRRQVRRCAELDGLAGHGADGDALIRFEAVWMPQSGRTMADHGW